MKQHTPLTPRDGAQSEMMECDADVAIFMGKRAVGKTTTLLMSAAAWQGQGDEYYPALFTMRDSSFYHESGKLAGIANPSAIIFNPPSPSSRRLVDRRFDWIGMDDMDLFQEDDFWFLLSRLARTRIGGPRPLLRGTCELDPSWVARFASWYRDPVSGAPLMERSGIIRYFSRVEDKLMWGSSPDIFPVNMQVFSFTVIFGGSVQMYGKTTPPPEEPFFTPRGHRGYDVYNVDRDPHRLPSFLDDPADLAPITVYGRVVEERLLPMDDPLFTASVHGERCHTLREIHGKHLRCINPVTYDIRPSSDKSFSPSRHCRAHIVSALVGDPMVVTRLAKTDHKDSLKGRSYVRVDQGYGQDEEGRFIYQTGPLATGEPPEPR